MADIPIQTLEAAVEKLAPLFGLDPKDVSLTSVQRIFEDEMMIDNLIMDTEGSARKYFIGSNLGTYLHKRAKPDFYQAEKQLGVFFPAHEKFPSIDDSPNNFFHFVKGPIDVFSEFVRHYCGLYYEDADISPSQLRKQFGTTEGETIRAMKAAEIFVKKRSPADFTRVVNMPLNRALAYINEVTGVDVSTYRLLG